MKKLSRYQTLKVRVDKFKKQKGVVVVQLDGGAMGYHQFAQPKTMRPEMMRRLLGGKFPNTGFGWECVYEFRYEDGAWHAYNEYDEILPCESFEVVAKPIEGSI